MGMSERWREEWHAFRASAPGRRFLERYERARCPERPMHERIARFLCGFVTILVGIVLIPLPGPGWLIVGFGVTMLAQESHRIARVCDAIELRFRGWTAAWRRHREERRSRRP